MPIGKELFWKAWFTTEDGVVFIENHVAKNTFQTRTVCLCPFDLIMRCNMPELPDVEVFRNYCSRHILDRKIDSVTAQKNRVMKSSPAILRNHLEGRAFRQTARHGKYLFLATDTRELVLHFGMTGSVRYMENPQDIEHCPLILDFDDGSRLAFISVRKLGKVLLVDDRKKFIEKKQAGS